MIKNYICVIIGSIGVMVSRLFGGWNSSLTTLVIFMIIDYITALIQAIEGKSLKSENGKLSSSVGFKGIFKKVMILLMVLVGYRVDVTFNLTYVKQIITLSYICNEFISIVENLTYMGMDKLPIFDKIAKLIKGEIENNESN